VGRSFEIYREYVMKWNKVERSGTKVQRCGEKMFIGEYNHSLDPKNRLIIPAKFREQLGEAFVMTKGLDNCLFVYSINEWSIVEEKLKSLPMTNKDARAFVRFFFAGASECEIDKQGRTLVPSNLKEYANIDKDVVIIGVSTRMEIWSLEQWNKFNNDADISYEDVAEKMSLLGI
jgi:MraZ protein